MKLYSLEGAKNSFVLLSFFDSNLGPKTERLINLDKKQLAELAQKLCHFSEVAVDGCVFVFPHTELDFAWEFYNSDGSDALMCGNAARAVSLWYYEFVNPKPKIQFFTPSQVVSAEVLERQTKSSNDTTDILVQGSVKVWLKRTNFVAKQDDYSIYNSGVPHLCIYLDLQKSNGLSFEQIGQKNFEIAKNLRFPKALDYKGANVTFIWADSAEALNNSKINAMSFERGVENWTQACGTGAMAAAYFVNETLGLKFPIIVQMPGGVLEINESENHTVLTGPALVQNVLDVEISI